MILYRAEDQWSCPPWSLQLPKKHFHVLFQPTISTQLHVFAPSQVMRWMEIWGYLQPWKMPSLMFQVVCLSRIRYAHSSDSLMQHWYHSKHIILLIFLKFKYIIFDNIDYDLNMFPPLISTWPIHLFIRWGFQRWKSHAQLKGSCSSTLAAIVTVLDLGSCKMGNRNTKTTSGEFREMHIQV